MSTCSGFKIEIETSSEYIFGYEKEKKARVIEVKDIVDDDIEILAFTMKELYNESGGQTMTIGVDKQDAILLAKHILNLYSDNRS